MPLLAPIIRVGGGSTYMAMQLNIITYYYYTSPAQQMSNVYLHHHARRFVGTLMANIKVLQNANVETFITFRSSTPLVGACMHHPEDAAMSLPNAIRHGAKPPAPRSSAKTVTFSMSPS